MPATHQRQVTDTAARREPFHDVSEGLFMENFSAHGSRPANPLLADCYDIRSTAVKECMELVNSVRRVYANPTLNTVQQDIHVGKLLKAPVTERANGFNALRKRVMERQSEVRQEIAALVRPTTSHESAIASDIRAHLRSLPDEKRSDLIASVLKTDDATMLYQAIVSAPGFLSGLAAGKHAALRQEYLAIRDPSYLGLEAGLDAEAARLQKAAEGVQRIFAERFDFARVEALAQLARGAGTHV